MTEDKSKRASDEAVLAATGKPWSEWFELLDKAGANKLAHTRIAGYLRSEYDVKPWWSQMVANGYEKERGLRVEGQTTSDDFQADVRRTMKVSVGKAWELVTGPLGIETWLGLVEDFKLEKGFLYRTAEGVVGEVRIVSPGNQIRLTWKPADWNKYSTIQIRFLAAGDKTVLGFSQTGLPDAGSRELAKQRWARALDELEEMI